MPTVQKEELVVEIKGRFAESESVIMTDYRGLTVKEMQELRGLLRGAGSDFKVYKNSLTQIAMRELALPSLDEYLAGPTAIVFAGDDPVAAAKVLNTFAKTHKTLVVKGGLVQNRIVDADGVQAIAALPSREQLIASLLGTMQNPLVKIVRVLNGPAAAFARVLNAIAEQKKAA
ncbi:MAG: 50S ribosomal protein L10 [Coriobacteriia bacterium]|nr:50S ribosomal protein L10 [Coriobacteriia bacterium]